MIWERIPVEAFCTQVVSGGTPPTKILEFYGGNIPWLRTQEVNFNNIYDTEIKITEAGLKNSAAKWIPANSVIVAMYGNSAGRVAINRIPLTTNQACCNLIIDHKRADFRYVYYALKLFYPTLKGQSRGAAQNNLNVSQVKSFEIPCPSLPTQRRIGDILSSYDDLIENNRRRIALLEQAARLLYREWFVHLRFPGYEHVKIIDGIPEGWVKGKVSDFGEIITGKTPSTKDESNYGGDIPFVKTPDMHGKIVVVKTGQTLSERGANSQPNKFIPKGSVMVSCIGTVGVVSIASVLCQTNQQINSVVFNNSTARYYGLFALSDLKPQLEGMGGGSTMGNVNKTKFSSLPVLIPEKRILSAFDEAVSPIFSQIETLELMNIKLAKARDLLLPRLMNGEIAV